MKNEHKNTLYIKEKVEIAGEVILQTFYGHSTNRDRKTENKPSHVSDHKF